MYYRDNIVYRDKTFYIITNYRDITFYYRTALMVTIVVIVNKYDLGIGTCRTR